MGRYLAGLCTWGGGCPTIVPAGRDRCDEHPRPQRRARRPSPSRRGYGSAWRSIRKAFLAAHPFCEWCGRPAEQVDHILPKSRGGSDDWANLRSLCARCHSRRTARSPGAFGRE